MNSSSGSENVPPKVLSSVAHVPQTTSTASTSSPMSVLRSLASFANRGSPLGRLFGKGPPQPTSDGKNDTQDKENIDVSPSVCEPEEKQPEAKAKSSTNSNIFLEMLEKANEEKASKNPEVVKPVEHLSRYEAIADLDRESVNEDERWEDRTSVITRWQHEEYVEFASQFVNEMISTAVSIALGAQSDYRGALNDTIGSEADSDLDASFQSTRTALGPSGYHHTSGMIGSDESEYESAAETSLVDTGDQQPSVITSELDELIGGLESFQIKSGQKVNDSAVSTSFVDPVLADLLNQKPVALDDSFLAAFNTMKVAPMEKEPQSQTDLDETLTESQTEENEQLQTLREPAIAKLINLSFGSPQVEKATISQPLQSQATLDLFDVFNSNTNMNCNGPPNLENTPKVIRINSFASPACSFRDPEIYQNPANESQINEESVADFTIQETVTIDSECHKSEVKDEVYDQNENKKILEVTPDEIFLNEQPAESPEMKLPTNCETDVSETDEQSKKITDEIKSTDLDEALTATTEAKITVEVTAQVGDRKEFLVESSHGVSIADQEHSNEHVPTEVFVEVSEITEVRGIEIESKNPGSLAEDKEYEIADGRDDSHVESKKEENVESLDGEAFQPECTVKIEGNLSITNDVLKEVSDVIEEGKNSESDLPPEIRKVEENSAVVNPNGSSEMEVNDDKDSSNLPLNVGDFSHCERSHSEVRGEPVESLPDQESKDDLVSSNPIEPKVEAEIKEERNDSDVRDEPLESLPISSDKDFKDNLESSNPIEPEVEAEIKKIAGNPERSHSEVQDEPVESLKEQELKENLVSSNPITESEAEIKEDVANAESSHSDVLGELVESLQTSPDQNFRDDLASFNPNPIELKVQAEIKEDIANTEISHSDVQDEPVESLKISSDQDFKDNLASTNPIETEVESEIKEEVGNAEEVDLTETPQNPILESYLACEMEGLKESSEVASNTSKFGVNDEAINAPVQETLNENSEIHCQNCDLGEQNSIQDVSVMDVDCEPEPIDNEPLSMDVDPDSNEVPNPQQSIPDEISDLPIDQFHEVASIVSETETPCKGPSPSKSLDKCLTLNEESSLSQGEITDVPPVSQDSESCLAPENDTTPLCNMIMTACEDNDDITSKVDSVTETNTPAVSKVLKKLVKSQSKATPQNVDIPIPRPETPTKKATIPDATEAENIKRHLFESPLQVNKPMAIVKPSLESVVTPDNKPIAHVAEVEIIPDKKQECLEPQQPTDVMEAPVRGGYDLASLLNDPSFNPFETKSSGIRNSFGTSSPPLQATEAVSTVQPINDFPVQEEDDTEKVQVKKPTSSRNRPLLNRGKPPSDADPVPEGEKKEKKERKPLPPKPWLKKKSTAAQQPPSDDIVEIFMPEKKKPISVEQGIQNPEHEIQKLESEAEYESAAGARSSSPPLPKANAYNLDFLDNLDDPEFNPFATKSSVSNDVEGTQVAEIVEDLPQLEVISVPQPDFLNVVKQEAKHLKDSTPEFEAVEKEISLSEKDVRPNMEATPDVVPKIVKVEEVAPDPKRLLKSDDIFKNETFDFNSITAESESFFSTEKPTFLSTSFDPSKSFIEKSHIDMSITSQKLVFDQNVSICDIVMSRDPLDPIREALARKELLYQAQLLEKDRELHKREREVQELEKDIHSMKHTLVRSNNSYMEMGRVLREYESTISELTSERERERACMEIEKERLIRERDETLSDLRSVERSFSDTHRRYERMKEVIGDFKKNEDSLKATLELVTAKLQRAEERFDRLRDQAQSKLNEANEALATVRKQREGEVAKLQAMIRKAEMRVSMLERTIEEKNHENLELTNICDELIAKVGK